METVTHDEVIPRIAGHLKPIFESSPDGVYWTCNERLASMFGYTVDELENSPNMLQRLVHEEDQGIVSRTTGTACRSWRSR